MTWLAFISSRAKQCRSQSKNSNAHHSPTRLTRKMAEQIRKKSETFVAQRNCNVVSETCVLVVRRGGVLLCAPRVSYLTVWWCSTLPQRSRLLLSLVIGAAAGILELTSQAGFVFYLVATLLLTVVHRLRLGSSYGDHFDSLWGMTTSGLLSSLLVSKSVRASVFE
jgi:EMC6